MSEEFRQYVLDKIKICCSHPELVNEKSLISDLDFRAYKFQRIISEELDSNMSVNEIKSFINVKDLLDSVIDNNMPKEAPNNIIDYFVKVGNLSRLHNGDDCLVFPNITENKLSAIRENFKIERNETILMFRDSSFWSSSDQGLAITNEGLYCINDNEKKDEEFYIDWGDVDHVEYQELMMYFFNASNKQIAQYPISLFAKNPATPMVLGDELSKLFTAMSSLVETKDDPLEVLIAESNELADKGNIDAAVSMLQEQLESVSDQVKWYLYYSIANIYYKAGEIHKAIKNSTNGLKYCEESSPAHVKLATLRSSAMEKEENFKSARKDCFDVIQYASDEDWNGKKCRNIANNKFSEYDERFVNDFLSLPYSERKVILPVREYVDLSQSTITVVKMSKFPDIELPIGHPVANQLYVGHPLIASKYIPFENYQLELVEDRVREFCVLAQSLGATEIEIDTINAKSSDENLNIKKHTNSDVDYKLASTNVEINTDKSRHMLDELTKTISLHQTFEPHNLPTLPENLVWYNGEPSWQRLYSQRVCGGLTSHEERIETKKSQVIEGRELSEIKGELKLLFDKMDVSFTSEEEKKFVQQENAVISIKVKFAPLSQLTSSTVTVINNECRTTSLSEEEKEYIEEYKEIIADGEISERDRRFLEKIKEANGICEERAKELEEIAIPKLTSEEQEYLDEYRDIIADGEISDRDRRFLEKIKKANDISDQRAKEIEAIA